MLQGFVGFSACQSGTPTYYLTVLHNPQMPKKNIVRYQICMQKISNVDANTYCVTQIIGGAKELVVLL